MTVAETSLKNFQADIDKWMAENVPEEPGLLVTADILGGGHRAAVRLSTRLATQAVERWLFGDALANGVWRARC
jgi:hypothetical protein